MTGELHRPNCTLEQVQNMYRDDALAGCSVHGIVFEAEVPRHAKDHDGMEVIRGSRMLRR